MRIIISPAKKMNIDTHTFLAQSNPVFLDKTQILLDWMKGLTFDEAKNLWKCNEKLADLNYRRFQEMDLHHNLTPAICSYEGLQYQHMAPNVFTDDALTYVQEHLRILSGFYGVLKPFDGVTPYRLEMQAKASAIGTNITIAGFTNLYDFWNSQLYEEVMDDNSDRVLINLASKEYSRCIEAHLNENDRFITCVFGEKKDGKIIQKGTMAKMARGEMVRFMAENNIKDPEELKQFSGSGYTYSDADSSESEHVFLI